MANYTIYVIAAVYLGCVHNIYDICTTYGRFYSKYAILAYNMVHLHRICHIVHLLYICNTCILNSTFYTIYVICGHFMTQSHNICHITTPWFYKIMNHNNKINKLASKTSGLVTITSVTIT